MFDEDKEIHIPIPISIIKPTVAFHSLTLHFVASKNDAANLYLKN